MAASARGKLKIVQLLLEHDAEVDAQCDDVSKVNNRI